MPYTTPPTGRLGLLLKHISKLAQGKRQAQIADEIQLEYNNLIKYTEAITDLLNQEEAGTIDYLTNQED